MTWCFFIPKATNRYSAGLLTYFRSEAPSRPNDSGKVCFSLRKFTAAGTVRDFHPVPFSSFCRRSGKGHRIRVDKGRQEIGKKQNDRIFFSENIRSLGQTAYRS